MAHKNIRNRPGILVPAGESRQIQARRTQDGGWHIVAETIVPNPYAAVSVNQRHVKFNGAIDIRGGESFRLLDFLRSHGLEDYHDSLVQEINAKTTEVQRAGNSPEKRLG